jgi:hypothetical protein
LLAAAQLVQRYRNLLTGAELLESSLRGDFPEYLNAEIVLRTIVDMFSAVAWLRSTYLYIRVSAPSVLPGLASNMHAPFMYSFLRSSLSPVPDMALSCSGLLSGRDSAAHASASRM